ncbi:hypothetical protein Rsub_12650 [Raphidocelis subcapitata]|uniref:Uncharacterized protein n=1 Tax=Raphidocelis subcapitata TaxID=307507 RepID=A0A2V0PQZ7_9CHLO|nr:hypothetical protein Rsub_12650 [Raphidocelis subcapitata]|eukprot:GBF99957.1 hypothetical protein Rsub_12650 [Raphidocelis subcapitata]
MAGAAASGPGERLRFAKPPVVGSSAAGAAVSEAAGRAFADAGFKLTGRMAMLPFRGPPPPRERAFVRGQGQRAAPAAGAPRSGGGVEVVAYRATPPGDFYVAK